MAARDAMVAVDHQKQAAKRKEKQRKGKERKGEERRGEEEERKEKTTPFQVNLWRSLVIYMQAAAGQHITWQVVIACTGSVVLTHTTVSEKYSTGW